MIACWIPNLLGEGLLAKEFDEGLAEVFKIVLKYENDFSNFFKNMISNIKTFSTCSGH